MSSTRPNSATSTGHNGLLRFKIQVAGTGGTGGGGGDGGGLGRHTSHRDGMALGLPSVKNLMDTCGVSEYSTAYYLDRQR